MQRYLIIFLVVIITSCSQYLEDNYLGSWIRMIPGHSNILEIEVLLEDSNGNVPT